VHEGVLSIGSGLQDYGRKVVEQALGELSASTVLTIKRRCFMTHASHACRASLWPVMLKYTVLTGSPGSDIDSEGKQS